MLRSTHVRPLIAAICVFAVGSHTLAVGGDYVGLDSATAKLYDLDTAAGTTTLIGTVAGAPVFGFGTMDRAPNGVIWAIAPGAVSGYSLYTIDDVALTATKKFTIGGSSAGGVGIAIEPSGNAAWVAGFIGLSLNVRIQRVDLTTGVKVDKGTWTGNCWGLGFDSAGDLFTTQQGAVGPVLVKIDQTDAANSVILGNEMLGVDMNFGLDLASANTVSLSLYSRSTGTIFSIDTSTGVESVVGNPGQSGVFTIAANDACAGLAIPYGNGCAGSGGFVPTLAVSGCPQVNDTFSIDLTNGLGNAPALYLVGLGQTSVPVGAGCTLLVGPLSPISLTLPLNGIGGAPGTGNLSIPVVVTPIFSGVSFTMQAWVYDPATGIGGAGTNGIFVSVP